MKNFIAGKADGGNTIVLENAPNTSERKYLLVHIVPHNFDESQEELQRLACRLLIEHFNKEPEVVSTVRETLEWARDYWQTHLDAHGDSDEMAEVYGSREEIEQRINSISEGMRQI